ncbi:hypothetical protein LS70_008260 [Helicobacter sp. MIT 11-5569]|uniref:DNA methyltransferase n=1 Tax=Helicobacter sp. MIT 11-5569 TaxID=1548151 RepID=UPI00055155F5|nr:DNA methyltransferase [Helicobacter sp. MIT 11-5569]TLD81272.1 hypothetical protein LS70_008260 [Helicobacter sp. MIT 11-5569]
MPTFDFSNFENAEFKENFKEDSVRELLIAPLLDKLGFIMRDFKNPKPLEIVRSLKITSPTILGSNEKITLTRFPDYVLYLDSKLHCVLDAKSPKEKINAQSKNERQAFYYAINPEIKAPYYALCNGISFVLFETKGQEILCEFSMQEIFANNFSNDCFALLKQYLTTPTQSLRQTLSQDSKKPKKSEEWYLSRELPKMIIKPQKRKKARHYGCLAYFTRQSWDIVTQNIKTFTDEGDVVLDPFGGSGVTAIEAMMNGRVGIHTDLNPLSIFMAKALSAQCDLSALYDLSEAIIADFESQKPKNDKEARQMLKNAKYYPNALSEEFGEVATQKEQDSTLWIPHDEILPKGSDVDSVLGLFSKRQLAELALLRKLIFKHTFYNRKIQKELRYSLMLAFYNTLNIANLTYHISEHKGLTNKAGDSSVFRYYRYRIAKKPTFVNITESFRGKVERVLKGKTELEKSPSDTFYQSYFYPLQGVIKDFKGAMINQRENLDKTDSLLDKTNGEKIFQADATNLKEIESQSVDFIYTDPPYGAKIPYLDLSTMWNVWLDLPVDSSLKEKECIEKGSLEKSRYEYYDLMKSSLKEMYRVLKFNRWLAFVFQHQDPRLFQIIVESAENVGFEYAGYVSQEDTGISSFKKVQNPTRVLKGQLILYFKKIDNPKAHIKTAVGLDSLEHFYKDAEEIIVKNNGATMEAISAHLVNLCINGGYTEIAAKGYNIVTLINERFDYDPATKLYHIRDEASILNYGIPLEERVRYFILGELTKAQAENQGVDFDNLCLKVIPLSKNGIQANKKMIKEILGEIADEKDRQWKLKDKKGTQGSLFDE